MRVPTVPVQTAAGDHDAEKLFRTKPVTDLRKVEKSTQKQIEDKKEDLRQLIGNRYRDLIDSADSILSMKSSCESISSNISHIQLALLSLSTNNNKTEEKQQLTINSNHENHRLTKNGKNENHENEREKEKRARIYGIASRVKYLVDTPENIWGCLDEEMFLEGSGRYMRARLVYRGVMREGEEVVRRNFPLLKHQWGIVESFKGQVSVRGRERLERRGGESGVEKFADALAGVAVMDEIGPREVLSLFLESRKAWIMQVLSEKSKDVVEVLCEVTRVIEVTVAEVGQMFLQVLNELPLFYKVVLESPPASQLFGGIPNPEEEVRMWSEFRERLEGVMVVMGKEEVAKVCSRWLRECGREIVSKINGRCLIDAVGSGEELALAEKRIRQIMDSKEVLEGSLEWLKSVFGSDIELPWSRTRELVLEESVDLWDEIFEDAFVSRMKVIIDSGFEELRKGVKIQESVRAIGESFDVEGDFRAYLMRPSGDGGVWFVEQSVKKGALLFSSGKAVAEEYDSGSSLSAYLGPEASRIRDAVDSCCHSVLENLLCFLESPKASVRLKDLAPYLQNKCQESISTILSDLTNELDKLRAALDLVIKQGGSSQPPAAIVERSLFIGRLLYAFQNHSKHIPVLLGSPRLWAGETMILGSEKLPSLSKPGRFSLDPLGPDSPGKQVGVSPRRQMTLAASALYGVNDNMSPKHEELMSTMRDLCIAAHGLWISWVSDELASILSANLRQDDGLSATTPSRGWEEVVVKQDDSSESESEMKVSLPSMPSLYITSFLFTACEEVHRVGGHVLDKTILQRFAKRLLEKVIVIYNDFLSNGSQMSEKGVLQVLLDLRFATDILSGCESNMNESFSRNTSTKLPFRRKQDKSTVKSPIRQRFDDLINHYSQRLDPIDWQTFEPYLWQNERQSYLRHAVLFGFFVQLNRLYIDTAQKLSNSESNIMRCSTVPRFKYLPISAPALSSRAASKTPIRTSSDDVSSRSQWKAYASGDLSPKVDFDDNSSFGVATPFLKSFMQVGSRFGEGTFKLGSMLTDARFKDKAAAMSSFGDILPMQAAGLFSNFTATRSDS